MLNRVQADRHCSQAGLGAPGPQQRKRHGECVVHQHLLARGDVEFLGDQRFDDVPRKLRIAEIGCDRRETPSLVRVAVLARGADCERRQLVQKEVQAVIVVDDDRHMWIRRC
jgi:hypothetical protein